MFKLNNDADINGTSLAGYVMLAPSKLVATFGEPKVGDEYKVSGEYSFENKDGGVATLYDWKCTSLYDSDMWSPEEFWNCSEPMEFHIGGASGGFEEWLLAEVRNGS